MVRDADIALQRGRWEKVKGRESEFHSRSLEFRRPNGRGREDVYSSPKFSLRTKVGIIRKKLGKLSYYIYYYYY